MPLGVTVSLLLNLFELLLCVCVCVCVCVLGYYRATLPYYRRFAILLVPMLMSNCFFYATIVLHYHKKVMQIVF